MALALVMALSVTTISWADDKAAEFNDQQYDTLLAAVQAAVQENTTAGKTIKLLGDVTEDVVDIEGLSNFMLTIDLNGRSYTGMIRKYHDLVVKDTSESQTGKAYFSYVMCNVLKLQGGTIVIDDAEIFHGTYLEGATVTINGGEYQNSSEANHTMAINFQEGSSLTINSGVFWTNDNLEKGGNTAVPYGAHFVVGRTEQGNYTIQKTSADGTTLYFYDLSTAAKAAADGDTITLLANQTIDRKVEVKNSVTIDGNGKSIALAETVKNLTVGPAQYAHGVFEFSGDNKTAVMKNLTFKGIDIDSVLIRAYNSGNNSCLTVDGCTFDNVKAINMVRGSSSTAVNCALKVTNCMFKSCKTITDGNGVVQIDSSNTTNATGNEIKNNSFIGNEVKPEGNAAVIYLSAPATVQNNCFEDNKTIAKDSAAKNGIVVTGSKAGASTIKENAFVSHTFTNGDAQGAIYGAVSATTVDNNYYGGGIDHTAKAGEGFTEGKVASSYNKNAGAGASVSSGSSSKYYYTKPSTDTAKDETKGSPKTFDAGVGIYAVTALLSVTGMAWAGKKRH